jgi:hypothetical protein
MKMPKAIMTTHEVAEYCGITDKEVCRLAAEGILKPVRGFRKPKKFSFYQIQMWIDGEDQKRK